MTAICFPSANLHFCRSAESHHPGGVIRIEQGRGEMQVNRALGVRDAVVA